MKLSRIERLTLANQFLILERLYPEDANHYAEKRKAIEEGYELHYDSLVGHLSDGLATDECHEVFDVLNMFMALRFSYQGLSDKSGIEEGDLAFPGFDGNEETRLLGYVNYIVDDLGRYEEMKEGEYNVGFNSHMPLLDTYRRMLEEWEASKDKRHLSLTGRNTAHTGTYVASFTSAWDRINQAERSSGKACRQEDSHAHHKARCFSAGLRGNLPFSS